MNNKIHESIPKAPLRILSWFCPHHLYEEIEGDLLEQYQRDLKKFSEKNQNAG